MDISKGHLSSMDMGKNVIFVIMNSEQASASRNPFYLLDEKKLHSEWISM